MIATHKVTYEQLEVLKQYLEQVSQQKGDLTKVKFMYTALSPENIYVKYVDFKLLEDNSILSKEEVKCVQKNGVISDCLNNFENLNQRLQFLSELVEVDFDANNNIIFV